MNTIYDISNKGEAKKKYREKEKEEVIDSEGAALDHTKNKIF